MEWESEESTVCLSLALFFAEATLTGNVIARIAERVGALASAWLASGMEK